MARIIDADILKENCRITGEFMNNFECVSLATLGEIIDKQPTIEAEPVKHGKWIEKYCSWYCSECGKSGYKGYIPAKPSDFCPNCGARMDGE